MPSSQSSSQNSNQTFRNGFIWIQIKIMFIWNFHSNWGHFCFIVDIWILRIELIDQCFVNRPISSACYSLGCVSKRLDFPSLNYISRKCILTFRNVLLSQLICLHLMQTITKYSNECVASNENQLIVAIIGIDVGFNATMLYHVAYRKTMDFNKLIWHLSNHSYAIAIVR